MSSYANMDAEYGAYGGGSAYEFSDKSIRQGFVRKVYAILSVQVAITTGFIALFLYSEPVKQWNKENPGFYIACLVLTLVLVIAMACCEGPRRKAPLNFICLFLFTIAEGFMLGAVSSLYQADAVILAAGITAMVCVAITVFAFQTKIDFTGMGAYLMVALLVFFLVGLFSLIFRSSFGGTLNIIYSGLGALLFSMYLVYDTQLLIGGEHKYSISPEEYIFAALNLYLDIVNIFLFILSIIGRRD